MVPNIAKERIRNIQMTIDELIASAVDLPESLTSAFVRRRPAIAIHYDKLLSDAYDSLIKASRKYDAKLCPSFRKFASSCITRRLIWSCIDIVKHTKVHEIPMSNYDSGFDTPQEKKNIVTLPDDYYQRLTRHQIRVLCLRFEGGYSFSQIARRCNCSKANAYRIYRRGIKKISVDI